MKITKAVIPAAGLGTRVLPATKAVPKEMYPIVDKPAIQYIVEEAVASGITDILIILNRGKGVVEDHFDRCLELERNLLEKKNYDLYDQITRITNLANIHFIRQKVTRGLGHAVSCAKTFIGNEPFAVLYGDDVIIGDTPACKELIDAYGECGKGVVGVKPVDLADIGKYCSLKVEKLHDKVFKCTDMIEKPTPDKVFSNYAILGRCVLPPEIFDILEQTQPGAGNEIQLTDAMAVIAREYGMTAVEFSGKRYDMGNKFGLLQAIVEVGLNHCDVSEQFRKYIKQIATTL